MVPQKSDQAAPMHPLFSFSVKKAMTPFPHEQGKVKIPPPVEDGGANAFSP